MATTDPRSADKAALLKRYTDQINWYWKQSASQKAKFIRSRFWVLLLGALVTLIASLAAAAFVESRGWLNTTFQIATPVLAAVLAVLTGLSQTFQWGAAWREMVMSAMALEKERDRVALTPAYRLDPLAEAVVFNDIVIGETQRFFERVTGSTRSTQIEAQAVADAQAAVAAVAARPRSVDLSPTPAAAYEETDTAYEADYAEAAAGEDAYAAEAEDTYAADAGEGENAYAADAEEGEDAYAGEGEDAYTAEDEEGDGGPPGGYAAEGEYEGEDEPPA